MALLVNLRHLQNQALNLKGELSADDLGLRDLDDLIRAIAPIEHDLTVQALDGAILVQGRLVVELACDCARCLKPFTHRVELPEWACHLPLSGPEKAEAQGDFVDLTPYVREDILLALPQHPLCEPECPGLPASRPDSIPAGEAPLSQKDLSPWAELDKLKF